MLNRTTSALLLTLTLALQPQSSQALEGLGIDECIQKQSAIENTLLSAFEDPQPKGNRPKAYYQVGAIITHEHGSKAHVLYLIVKHQSNDCQAIHINPYQGYETLVPGSAAIDMEVNHLQWEAKDIKHIPPKEEWVDVDPAEFGHGCEPIPTTRAEAMRLINYEYECPVMEQRQPLVWDHNHQHQHQH